MTESVLPNSITFGNDTNPNLLILHGLYGSSTNWRSLAQQYADYYHVHALDLRNHGQSPWHHEHNYAALSDDIAHYMHHHNLAHAAIIGHSMGGKVAMWFALTQPEKVSKLVIADIAPVSYIDNSHGGYLKAMKNALANTPTSRQAVDNALAQSIDSAMLRQFFLQNLVIKEGATQWRININALENNLNAILAFDLHHIPDATYSGPTLFIHGSKSDYILPNHEPIISTLFPQSQRYTVDGAGHWLHAEKPQEFFTQTQAFLTA